MQATLFDICAAVVRTVGISPKRPGEKCKVLLFPETSFICEDPEQIAQVDVRDHLVLRDILTICENALPIPEIDR